MGTNLRRLCEKEIALHNSAQSCWVTRNGRVYDVTQFIDDHPGGADLVLDWAGKDIKEIMEDQLEHAHSDSAYELLEDYVIGLVDNQNSKFSNDAAHSELKHRSKTPFLDLEQPLLYQVWTSKFSKEFYLQQIHIPRHMKDPAYIFGAPYLEIFTRTPWYVVPIVWVPVSFALLYTGYINLSPVLVPMLYVLGLIAWTISEYAVHRFVFHLDELLPDHPAALTLHFLLHGIHHFLPMDRMRLVLPPILFAALLVVPWHIFRIFLNFNQCCALLSGAIHGYIVYDLMHYFLHHGKPFIDHLREMKTYHLNHHYKNYELGFGITSKFWDKVFGTVLNA
ncbi:hypothetical protein BKA69DRAFT_1025109 [Paraphysoderma sedebokerense]|nr:hypothetical protein BKA69DRAFT_1025109 [Paraphysoderma sedebokerense]